MEIFMFNLIYEENGMKKTEMFPSVLQRIRRENELRRLEIPFIKETQKLSL